MAGVIAILIFVLPTFPVIIQLIVLDLATVILILLVAADFPRTFLGVLNQIREQLKLTTLDAGTDHVLRLVKLHERRYAELLQDLLAEDLLSKVARPVEYFGIAK